MMSKFSPLFFLFRHYTQALGHMQKLKTERLEHSEYTMTAISFNIQHNINLMLFFIWAQKRNDSDRFDFRWKQAERLSLPHRVYAPKLAQSTTQCGYDLWDSAEP